MERQVQSAVQGATIDLDLWLEEWAALSAKHIHQQDNIDTLNMRVQHAYALLTIHLRALSVGSIENIAAMTFNQQGLAQAAQQAAVKHLKLILTRSYHPQQDNEQSPTDRPYLANFRYAGAATILLRLILYSYLNQVCDAFRLGQVRIFSTASSATGSTTERATSDNA